MLDIWIILNPDRHSTTSIIDNTIMWNQDMTKAFLFEKERVNMLAKIKRGSRSVKSLLICEIVHVEYRCPVYLEMQYIFYYTIFLAILTNVIAQHNNVEIQCFLFGDTSWLSVINFGICNDVHNIITNSTTASK